MSKFTAKLIKAERRTDGFGVEFTNVEFKVFSGTDENPEDVELFHGNEGFPLLMAAADIRASLEAKAAAWKADTELHERIAEHDAQLQVNDQTLAALNGGV